MPYDLGQIAGGCRQEEVIVIVHEAIDMDDCFISNDRRLQISKKPFSVPIIPEYVLSLISTGGYMIEGTGDKASVSLWVFPLDNYPTFHYD